VTACGYDAAALSRWVSRAASRCSSASTTRRRARGSSSRSRRVPKRAAPGSRRRSSTTCSPEGRAGGYAIAQLNLFIGNTPAQRVYERAGFAITAEKRSANFEAVLGGPGVAQMTAPLR
jgi:hypothetical protein